MNSSRSKESPRMIERTTEALWRVLWFLVYLIFIPTLITVLFFFIFGFIIIYALGISDFIIPIALSAIVFIISVLIFYRPYDKYRKKSIIQNKVNNPRARIHILFLITLVSLMYTPIFLMLIEPIAPGYQERLSLLPLITFVLIYNSVYLYFYLQPIDYFNVTNKNFSHFNQLKDTIKQPYNLIVFVNYITHILFLSYTFDMQLPYTNIPISWSLAFVSNLIFYIISLVSTAPYSKKIEKSILNQEIFLEELVLFKKSFVKSIIRLDFFIIIQIPFGILSVYFQIWGLDAIINALFISVILLIFSFKLNIYIKAYYLKQLNRLKPEKYDVKEKGVKSNFVFSFLFIILIPLYIFYYSITINPIVLNFNFLALPFIYLITHVEEKYGYLPKNQTRHLFLINTILILVIFSFQIINLIFPNLDILIHFAIFFISLYFSLEIFAKFDYYKKKDVLIFQNIVAMAGFYCLTFLIFPDFPFQPGLVNTFNSIIGGFVLPCLVGTIFSFYLIYFRHYYKNPWKSLRISLIINYLLILILSFYLLNLVPSVMNVIISVIGLSFLYILFTVFNYVIGVFNRDNMVSNIYTTIWVLDFSVFSALLINTLVGQITLLTIVPDFLIFSTLIQITLWSGKKLGKVSEDSYFKLFSFNGFFLISEIFILTSQFFISYVFPESLFIEYDVIAYFFSTLIVSLIINIAAPTNSPLIIKVKKLLNLFTVFYGLFVLEMIYFLLNYQNFFLITYGLIIISSIIGIIPIGFLVLTRTLPKQRLLDYMFVVLNVICLGIFSFLFHFSLLSIGMDNSSQMFFTTVSLVLSLIISYIGIGKVGSKLGYISKEFYVRFVKAMYYPIGVLLFLIFFSLSLVFIPQNYFISFLIALSALSFISNSARLLVKTMDKINTRMTIITLFYANFYFALMIVNSLIITPFNVLDALTEWFIYLYCALAAIQLISYIPFRYLTAKKIIKPEKYYKISYYSLFVLALFVFLIISSFFYHFYFREIPGVYILALIADIIYMTITSYNHIKRGFIKGYLPKIHLSKRAALYLYSTLFIEFYAFLLTMILLLLSIFTTPGPFIIWFSSYLAFVAITLVINVLANNMIIFSFDFSRRINLISFVFTSIIITYLMMSSIENIVTNQFLLLDLVVITFIVSFLIPTYYAIYKNLFTNFFNKKMIYISGIILSILVILLPSLISMQLIELTLINIQDSLNYILYFTSFLIFFFLKYVEHIFDELKVKVNLMIALKTIQLIFWNSLSFFISFTLFNILIVLFSQFYNLVLLCSIIIFFAVNLNTLVIIDSIKQHIFENEQLGIDYYKIYKIYEFYKNFSYFAFVFLSSGLITILSFPLTYLISSLIPPYTSLLEFIQLAIFFFITLLMIIISRSIEIEYQKIRNWVLLISWFGIKCIICSIVYLTQSNLFMALSFSILVFSVLSPFTVYFVKEIRLLFGTTIKIVNGIIICSFYGSLILFYISYFWNFVSVHPFFIANPLLFWVLLAGNLWIYTNYVIVKLRDVFNHIIELNILKLFLKSFLVLFLFIFVDFYLNLLLWFLSAVLSLRKRSYNILRKVITYLIFTFIFYTYLILDFPYLNDLDWKYLNITINGSIILVLLISILSNLNMGNILEKFSVYVLLAFSSFLAFSLIPNFPLLYNSTFSLLIFLTFTGNHFYQKGDNRYKLFIRPCIVLAVFDFTSFIFYGLIFNNPIYVPEYQPILSFTSTFTFTGFAFVSLYNESPQRFRKISFFIVLPLLVLSVPLFVYFFTYASFPGLRETVVPLTIASNTGLFFFYVAIGFYQWKFSRAIWKAGFWIWILFPILNYAIINETLANFRLRALNLFGFIDIPGSSLLAITICIILSFPFWYTWIKQHFATILFATWIINLGLIYWFSQTLFIDNPLLTNLAFLVFSIILLMPLVYKIRIWKALMAFWILFTIISIFFINFFFEVLETSQLIAIDVSFVGLSLIFLSYFPNMKNKRSLSLLLAYFVLMSGLSLLVYNIVFLLLPDPIASLYITMIIISSSLISSRLLKINKILINFLISWILVISFALLTFHIYGIIMGFPLEAFYFSLTVAGVTFFIFNRYKMLWGTFENLMPVSSLIASLAISAGTSLSTCSIILIFIDQALISSWFLIISVFLFINTLFLSFRVKNYRIILWYIFPIPSTFIILYGLSFFEAFSDPQNIILTAILVYSIINQFMKINRDVKSILRLLVYIDSALISFLLLNDFNQDIIILNVLFSSLILFSLSFLDIVSSKERKYWYIVLSNLLSYLFCTVYLFWYLNDTYLALFPPIIWLSPFIFILLQKYTAYAIFTILKSLNKYDLEKLMRFKSILNFILSNSLYILFSLFTSTTLYNAFSLDEIASIYLGFMSFFLIYFVLVAIFNRKVKAKIMNITRLSIFACFQISLFLFWTFIPVLGLGDIIFLMLILIIETILSYYSFNLISNLFMRREESKVRISHVPILNFILYTEISLLSYGLFNLIIKDFSIISSITVFFALTLFELGVVKKINMKLMRFSHLISFFTITLLILDIALNILLLNLTVFYLILVLFLIMQFYTIQSIFAFLSHFAWFIKEKALKVKQMTNNILINSIFVLLSILGTQFFTEIIQTIINDALIIHLYYWVYYLTFSSLIFILNGTVNRTIEKSLRIRFLLLPSFIAMQLFTFSLLINLMILVNDANFYIFWLSFIALIETILSIYPLRIVRKTTESESKKLIISKMFKIMALFLYLEITILSFGLLYSFLNDPFQSLLYSQLILFGLSYFEIFGFKRFKVENGYLMHLLSYLTISASLVFIIFIFSGPRLEFLYLLVILMQFYSNYVYLKIRLNSKPNKSDIYQKWAVRRQRIIGNVFYVVLVLLVSHFLFIYSGLPISHSLFLISILIHAISLIDRIVLIFLGKLSMSLIVISLISINIFSIPSLLDLVLSTDLSYRLIPLVIIIFEIELYYLTKLTNKWDRLKKMIISVNYFNLASWPIYFYSFNPLIDFNLILFTFFLLYTITRVDRRINALNPKVLKGFSSVSLFILGFGLPIDIFILLEFNVPNLPLNAAVSTLFGTIELGIIKKPYSRKRGVSFIYTLSLLIELLIITNEIDVAALGYSILVIALLIYVYTFMLEEIKLFLSHIVDYVRKAVNGIRAFISRIIKTIFEFLKKNYVFLKVLFSAVVGIMLGYLSTVLPILGLELSVFDPPHAPLFGFAVFGLLIGLFPGSKTDDPDKIFRTRMIRFSTIWFGVTIFILLIIPTIDLLLQIIMILSSFLILGLILAIYIWRIEKKQKISIKWRFYITVSLIIMLIIWGILLAILYFTS